jgi:uridine kinase
MAGSVSDLIDLTILVDVPIAVRHARLEKREDATFLKAWHERWNNAEAWYLTEAKPLSSFDLVISNS